MDIENTCREKKNTVEYVGVGVPEKQRPHCITLFWHKHTNFKVLKVPAA